MLVLFVSNIDIKSINGDNSAPKSDRITFVGMSFDYRNAKYQIIDKDLCLRQLNSKFENWKYLACRHNNHNLKSFMAFIFEVIKKRISNLIGKFDVPKIPPHMIDQLGVEKEASSTN